MARRRHYHHHHAHGGMARGCGHGYAAHHGEGEEEGRGWSPSRGRGLRPRMARRWMLRRLFRELDATPAQERAIVAELEQLEQRMRAAAELAREGRQDLAQALASPQLDDDALQAMTSRWDTVTGDVREASLGALRAVHALLDDGQRRRLAELMDRRPWWRGAGPYR